MFDQLSAEIRASLIKGSIRTRTTKQNVDPARGTLRVLSGKKSTETNLGWVAIFTKPDPPCSKSPQITKLLYFERDQIFFATAKKRTPLAREFFSSIMVQLTIIIPISEQQVQWSRIIKPCPKYIASKNRENTASLIDFG
jgi:hypothetical protein